jgi:predicted RNase H-like nuclease (RuvC/YqgF family)
MNSEELALQLAQHVHYEELIEPLQQNYRNIQELMRIIQDLKKELRNKQRDIDVLYFELANYKPDTDEEYTTPDPLSIVDEEYL